MKLIIIHGPPAAGKLTVGTELARLLGYKLFHNHLSIDFVKPVFDFGTPKFWDVIGEVRALIIAEAAREGISLIHTFCYGFGVDDDHFSKLIAACENNGGDVHLVLLRCDDEERKKRIGSESRLRIGKLTDPASIGSPGISVNLTTPLPGRETLIIDTTNTPPDVAAERIATYFRLLHQSPLFAGDR
ncbi:MAG: AAA family ATPase [Pyrinomonadaceae bacterium]